MFMFVFAQSDFCSSASPLLCLLLMLLRTDAADSASSRSALSACSYFFLRSTTLILAIKSLELLFKLSIFSTAFTIVFSSSRDSLIFKFCTSWFYLTYSLKAPSVFSILVSLSAISLPLSLSLSDWSWWMTWWYFSSCSMSFFSVSTLVMAYL